MFVEHIKIDNLNTNIDFEIRGSSIIIHGKSSIGKSYFVDELRREYNGLTSIVDENSSKTWYNRLVIFDYTNKDLSQIKNLKGKVIVIDNADEILDKNSDVFQFINSDTYNQYIIIARDLLGYNIMPNYVATLKVEHKEKNYMTLQYDSNEEGWW